MDYVDFQQARQRLGKSAEELEQMIKQGEIRAFRDGGTWKFRKEDIDALAPAAAEKPPAEEPVLAGEGEEDAGDTLMSIDADILFAEEEEVPADSAAETWIAADTESVFPGAEAPGAERASGVEEAMAAPEVEPAPLVLSAESDESSLGAVLSDEELAAPAEEDVFAEEPVIAVDSESGLAAVVSGSGSAAAPPSRTRVVTLVEPPAHHASFTVLLGMTIVALCFTSVVLVSLLTGYQPDLVYKLGSRLNAVYVLSAGAVIVMLISGIGLVLDKQRERREAMAGG